MKSIALKFGLGPWLSREIAFHPAYFWYFLQFYSISTLYLIALKIKNRDFVFIKKWAIIIGLLVAVWSILMLTR